LPPAEQTGRGNTQGGRVRPIEITFRLQNTAVLRLDTGKGFVDVPFKRFGDSVLDSPPTAFTGDKSVKVLGWKKESTEPLWRIEQDSPFPFTLLAVMAKIKLNG